MKLIFTVLLILSAVSLESCGEKGVSNKTTETKDTTFSLNGDWTLFKEEKKGQKLDYASEPIAVTITFKENGYFIFYDKITNEEISNSGVPKIQERYKGQYEIVGKELNLNHFINDSLISENFTIEGLTASELILKSKRTSNIQYFKK